MTLRYSLLLSVWVDPSAEHIPRHRLDIGMLTRAACGCQRYREILLLLFSKILPNIQLTPQKLSAGGENLPGAPGPGKRPDDQKMHRGRRPDRHRYQEVLLKVPCSY